MIPASPELAATGVGGWSLAAADRFAALDLDGDGRIEIVVAADQLDGEDNRRRFGLLRDRGGTLVLDRLARLPRDWNLPAGAPVVLRSTLVQSPSRRRELLLLVNELAPAALGVLGVPSGTADLSLVATTTNGSVPGAGGAAAWSIDPNASFVAADLDGDGLSEVVAVQRPSATAYRLTVIDVREAGFTVQSSQVFESTDDFGGDPAPTIVKWVVAARRGTGTSDSLLMLREQDEPATGRVDHPVLMMLRWDPQANLLRELYTPSVVLATADALTAIGFDPPTRGTGWIIGKDDTLVAARLGLRADGQEFVASTPTRPARAVFVSFANEVRMPWHTASVMPGSPPLALDWTPRPGDGMLAADLDGDGLQELVLISPDLEELAIVGRTGDGSLAVRAGLRRIVRDAAGRTESGWRLAAATQYLVGDLDGDGCEEIVAFVDGRLAVLRGLPPRRSAFELGVRSSYGPSGVTALDVVTQTSPRWTPNRPAAIRDAYELNRGVSGQFTDDPDVRHLDEAYYFVPIELALRLRDSTAALDWVRTCYDYEREPGERKIAYNLVLNGDAGFTFARAADWLEDPLNPHTIAATRKDAYTRFTIITACRILLDYAGIEFTRATSESLPHARELYLEVLELLDAAELNERSTACDDILGKPRDHHRLR